MYVKLNVDGQFGNDGPGKGAVGEALSLRLIDGDYWLLVSYYEYPEFKGCWTLAKHVLHPDTSGTETFYKTL